MTQPHPVRTTGVFARGSQLVRFVAMLTAAAVLGLFAPDTVAQESAKGTIKGRVLNAANGMYVGKARVSTVADGEYVEALTNDFGEYELYNLPAGQLTLMVSYIGQETISGTVTVEAGKTVTQDFAFNSQQSTKRDDGTVVLNEFLVQSERYKNATQIAINEERTAVNIKNVIAADAFGDIPSGNVGEFVKFIPGILIEYGPPSGAQNGYSESDANGINVRGFSSEDTAIMIDGVPVSNASPASLSRAVGLDMLSINNASRIEVTKVPTPDMPANSIGGQVNLITRSAFEYAKPRYNWSFYITGDSNNLDFKKTPGPTNKATYKLAPSAQISVVYPFSSKLGATLSLSRYQEFSDDSRAQINWSIPATPTQPAAATMADIHAALAARYSIPSLNQVQITETPRITTKNSGNLRVDWKPFEGSTISANIQYSDYDSDEAARRLDFRTGTPQSYGPNFTIGQAPGNGTPRVAMTVTTRDKVGDTTSGSLNWTFRKNAWDVRLLGSLSVSNGEFVDRKNGHFSEVAAILGGSSSAASTIQLDMLDINEGVPGKVQVRNNTGNPIDYTQLTNYRFDGTVAKSGEAKSKDTIGLYQLDVRRELDFLPGTQHYNAAIKVGIRRDQKKNEKSGIGTGYQETVNPGKSILFSSIIDDTYINQSPGFNQPPQQWISTYKLYQLDQQFDIFGVNDESTRISNYNSYVGQNKSITETKDAWYTQLEGRFLNNRLNVVGGLRQERNERTGRGPYTDNRYNYVKNKDGTIYRDNVVVNVGGVNYTPYVNGVNFGTSGNITVPRADGTGTGSIPNPFFVSGNDGGVRSRLVADGLWFPSNPDGTPRVVSNATLEGRMLQLQANKRIHQTTKGDPSYSINVAYDITKDIVGKIAWSRTFGQISFEDSYSGILSGNGAYIFDEFATPDAGDGTIGRIRVANPALEPWIANNWDFSIAYYTKNGGKLTLSYFTKQVENFQVNYVTYYGNPVFDDLLRAGGFDPTSYTDYRLETSTNGTGLQKTHGIEIEVQQDFTFLGGWGKYFSAFASYTHKSLGQPVEPKPIPVVNPITGATLLISPTGGKTITQSANEFAGGGIQFSNKRVSASIKGTYRNRNERSRAAITYTQTGVTGAQQSGNFLRTFDPSEVRIDVSAEYRITDKFAVFATARDVFNGERNQYREDDLGWYQSYSRYNDRREFGVEMTLGVKGSF